MAEWQRLLKERSLSTLQQLVDRFGAEQFPDLHRLQQAADNFEFRISPAMLDLIHEPGDPIWRQYIPDLQELDVVDGMGQPGMPPRTEAHLGYLFDPAYGRRGYATEAVIAMVAHAFDRLGIRRITAGCYADNLASVRVLEKVGMRREQHGVGDSWHAELGWVDGYTYALLAETWRRPAAAA